MCSKLSAEVLRGAPAERAPERSPEQVDPVQAPAPAVGASCHAAPETSLTVQGTAPVVPVAPAEGQQLAPVEAS